MTVSKLLSLVSFAAGVLSTPIKRDGIPSFVLDYGKQHDPPKITTNNSPAPLVYLDTAETYNPGPISSQLLYTAPSVQGSPNPLTLDNLSQLNSLGGSSVSLNSKDDFTTYPSWLNGVAPDSTGKVGGDPSSAIIVNDYQNGTVYAFYMYFYNFNLGDKPWILGYYAGNHVGDWEHNAIKFTNGQPESIWYSQHSSGEAFTYDATQKIGLRPVAYSAKGTHANYAQPGTHDHTIPGLNLPFTFVITDTTSQGALWDPTLNSYLYSYRAADNSFAAFDGVSPTSYLSFQGTWGDPQLPTSDSRQRETFGISVTAEWTGGPTGPDDKQLNRPWICAATSCPVYTSLRARDDEQV